MDKNIVAILLALWALVNSLFILVLLVLVIKEWINNKICGKVREETEEISDVLQDSLKNQEEKTCQAFGKVGRDIGELRRAIMHFHPEAMKPEQHDETEQAENCYKDSTIGF